MKTENEEIEKLMENAVAIVLHRKLDRLRKRRKVLDEKILKTSQELTAACTHEKTHIKDTYVEGSYYDRAQYHHITICDLCDKEINRVTTSGGYG